MEQKKMAVDTGFAPGSTAFLRTKRLLICLALLMAAVQPLFANLQFSPMIAVFVPSLKQNAQTFSMKNTGSEEMAVRVRIMTRTIDENGEETRADPGDLFTIYPSQAILKGGEERLVRVTWKGGTVNDRERAFRIIAEQLPVDFSGSGGEGLSVSLTMQFKYEGSLYVSPRKAEPKISAGIVWQEGKPFLVLENTGTGHLVILEPQVFIRDPSGTAYEIPASELQAISGRNILAGGRRVLSISVPSEFVPDKKISVSFSSKEE